MSKNIYLLFVKQKEICNDLYGKIFDGIDRLTNEIHFNDLDCI